jgi:hypothetical protein
MGSCFGPGIFAENCIMRLVLIRKMSSIVNVASDKKLRSAPRTIIFVQVSAKKYACYMIKRLVAYSCASRYGSNAVCSYQLLP